MSERTRVPPPATHSAGETLPLPLPRLPHPPPLSLLATAKRCALLPLGPSPPQAPPLSITNLKVLSQSPRSLKWTKPSRRCAKESVGGVCRSHKDFTVCNILLMKWTWGGEIGASGGWGMRLEVKLTGVSRGRETQECGSVSACLG